MPEEVVLLVENGICHLIHSPSAIIPPTPSQIEQHELSRLSTARSLQLEAEAAAVEKVRKFAVTVNDSAEVRRKREERRRGKQKQKEEEEDVAASATPLIQRQIDAQTPAEQTDPSPNDPSTAPPPCTKQISAGQPYFTTVPSTPLAHPWFSPSTASSTYHSLSSALASRVWTYPTTLLERARCASFRAIWEQGMYSGHGVRFGGEFLVYPGDPLRYHSHFVNTTLPSADTVIRPMELVAWGRLGTATKKAHLICCYDEDGASGNGNGEEQRQDEKVAGRGTVDCYSLEWGNFG